MIYCFWVHTLPPPDSNTTIKSEINELREVSRINDFSGGFTLVTNGTKQIKPEKGIKRY